MNINYFEKYAIYLEDRRNLLPKTFIEFLDKYFKGDFDKFLVNYDINPKEWFHEQLLLQHLERKFSDAEIAEWTKERYEDELTKIANEMMFEDIDYKYDDWLYKYNKLQFPLTIYRAITLEADSIDDIAKLEKELKEETYMGEYWAYEEEYAEAHWGSFREGNNIFILKATINEDNVNWKQTLMANIHPDLGELEQEINLIQGMIIQLTGIKMKKGREHTDWEKLNFRVRV